MFKWTTGTETPAPSFPCSKEQQEQQARAVCPLQALGEGQEGNASPQQSTSGGSHPSFGCREQDTAPGHGGSTSTAPQACTEEPQGPAGMGNPGKSRSNQQPNQPDYSLPRVLRKQQYGVCPHSQPGLQHNTPSWAHTTLLQRRDAQGRGFGKGQSWEWPTGACEHSARDTHPTWPRSSCRNPATRTSCLKTAFAAASLEFHPPSPSPCSSGISTKRQGSITKRFICSRRFKSPLCASQQGQQSPAPVRQHGPLGLAQSQSHFHTELAPNCLLNNFSTRWLELICDLGWDGSCWQVPPLNHHEQMYKTRWTEPTPPPAQLLLSCSAQKPVERLPELGTCQRWRLKGAKDSKVTPRTRAMGTVPAATPGRTPKAERASLTWPHSSPDPILVPFPHTESLQLSLVSAAHAERPNPTSSFLPRRVYKHTFPPNHAKIPKPLRRAKAQNNLELCPKVQVQEVPQLWLSLALQPGELWALLPAQASLPACIPTLNVAPYGSVCHGHRGPFVGSMAPLTRLKQHITFEQHAEDVDYRRGILRDKGSALREKQSYPLEGLPGCTAKIITRCPPAQHPGHVILPPPNQ